VTLANVLTKLKTRTKHEQKQELRTD